MEFQNLGHRILRVIQPPLGATALRPVIIAALAALSGAVFGASVAAGDESSRAAADSGQKQQEKAVAVPYKSRPAPSYRISLKDGRLFFLTGLDRTDSGYVLHTLEGEDIQVDESQVEEIVELNKQ